MLVGWVWNHLPPRSGGEESPRWADRHRWGAVLAKIALLMVVFTILTVLGSVTVFPHLENVVYNMPGV